MEPAECCREPGPSAGAPLSPPNQKHKASKSGLIGLAQHSTKPQQRPVQVPTLAAHKVQLRTNAAMEEPSGLSAGSGQEVTLLQLET